jgi:hypothetical protein
MNGPGRVLSILVVVTIVALAASGIPAGADPGAAPTLQAPLTNEDIVRMVASGTGEREVIETIRDRTETFDLTDDMVEELKLAGVSAAIVAAMRKRHVDLAPPAPPVQQPARGRTAFIVRLNGGSTLRVPAWADEDAKSQLHLPKENDQREVKDLAVFLACATSEHVPDLWRSKSPLGRDMSFVVRHEMLAFVPGDTPAGKSPRLVLPEQLDAQADETEVHDLVLGVAARIGDRWVQLGAATVPKARIAPGEKPLVGRIEHRGRGFDFKVELKARP